MKYLVRFARNSDIDNIQRETVNTATESQAREMFTSCDCWVYSVDPVIDIDDADILAAARTVSPAAVLTSGELTDAAYGASELNPDNTQFGSAAWFAGIPEESF